MYDIIIIGAGPSGMTAALYAARAGKKTLILEKDNFGGQIANSPRLENYPSIKEISGAQFAENLFDQITGLGVDFELETVESINKDNNVFQVTTNYNAYDSKAVIIATGLKHRKLGLDKEEDFIGHGISFCAVCDGAFYKDQEVVLVGDGNTALQYTILLSNYCKKVTVCTLFDKFFGENCLIETVKNRSNIDVIHNMKAVRLNGENELNSVTFETKDATQVDIGCKCLFVCIGQVPSNDLFSKYVDLDKGFIKVNSKMETKTPGLFAVGDCTVKDVRQVATAINDGAIAATIATKYIDTL